MPSKEGVEKNQKRKSLLRALTANRLMAEAVRFELTCRLLDNLISSLGRRGSYATSVFRISMICSYSISAA